MIDSHEALTYLGLSLLAPFLLLAIPGMRRLPLLWKMGMAGFGMAMMWVPFIHGQMPLFYARGLLATISVPTQVLMGLGVARAFGWRNSFTQILPRDLGFLLMGMFFFLFLCTLGYIHYDLYAWGYRPRALLGIAGILLAWAWRRHPGLAIAWLAGLAAFACNLGPSINLWDSLGDPLLALGGLWRILVNERSQKIRLERQEKKQLPTRQKALQYS